MTARDGLRVTELVLGVALVGVLVLLVAVYVRRRLIARGASLVLCAGRAVGESVWRARLARVDRSTLELFSLGGLSTRPVRSLPRGLDLLVAVSSVPRGQWPPLMNDPMVLRLLDEGQAVDFAVPRSSYTSLRSWIESSPPGNRHQAA